MNKTLALNLHIPFHSIKHLSLITHYFDVTRVFSPHSTLPFNRI